MRALGVTLSYSEYLEMPAILVDDLLILAEAESAHLKALSEKKL